MINCSFAIAEYKKYVLLRVLSNETNDVVLKTSSILTNKKIRIIKLMTKKAN